MWLPSKAIWAAGWKINWCAAAWRGYLFLTVAGGFPSSYAHCTVVNPFAIVSLSP